MPVCFQLNCKNVFLYNQDIVELKQPVAKTASILHGKLAAVKMVEFVQVHADNRHIRKVKIFSNSQSNVGILSLGWEEKQHRATVMEIQQLWKEAEERGLDWTPGHADVKGNVVADRLAKKAMKEAEEMLEVTSHQSQ